MTRQNADAIEASFGEFFKAIALLREAKLIQPCLVLLYSTIDAAAWLGRPDDRDDVTKHDFTSWVDRYVLQGRRFECRAIDLYAARCGLLHSFTAYSRLSRRGEAHHLAYSWGVAKRADLEVAIQYLGKQNIAAVHLDELIEATVEGFGRFLSEVSRDGVRLATILERGGKLYSHLPTIAVTRYNEIRSGSGEGG